MNTTEELKTVIENPIAVAIRQQFALTDIAAQLLCVRGIKNISDAGSFLYPRLSMLHSPFHLRNMRDAVSRIRRAMDSQERIGIFADSDIDGLTALSITSHIEEGTQVRVSIPFDNPIGLEQKWLSH